VGLLSIDNPLCRPSHRRHQRVLPFGTIQLYCSQSWTHATGGAVHRAGLINSSPFCAMIVFVKPPNVDELIHVS
jgi:hypothetical protein